MQILRVVYRYNSGSKNKISLWKSRSETRNIENSILTCPCQLLLQGFYEELLRYSKKLTCNNFEVYDFLNFEQIWVVLKNDQYLSIYMQPSRSGIGLIDSSDRFEEILIRIIFSKPLKSFSGTIFRWFILKKCSFLVF